MPLTVEHVASPTDDARALIGELDAELNAGYPPEQRHGFSVDRVFQPDVMFFIARLDGQPAGCGGVAFADGYGEVKRMYVRPPARGRNVAQAVLERVEHEAQSRRVPRLVLETGDIRHAAMRFYERAGFKRCGPFGPYLAMPLHAIQRSVFYEKPLA